MKTMLRLTLALLFCVTLCMCLVPDGFAEGGNTTQEQAIAWITARREEGWHENYDGSSYDVPQCVDLIVYYCYDLFGWRPSGNGYDYLGRDDLPDGWYYTDDPAPGDIAVWDAWVDFARESGHVALVEAVEGSTFFYVDVNGATGEAGSGSRSVSAPSSFLRPFFSTQTSSTFILGVDGWLDGNESATLSDYGTFDVYINGSCVISGVNDYYASWPSGTEYEIKNITANPGYRYNGVHAGTIMGTIGNMDAIICLAFDNTIIATGFCGVNGDNLRWTLYDDGLLSITGTGAMADMASDNTPANPPWYSYKSFISRVTISEGVTSIGRDAFVFCDKLSSVAIPSTVTGIGREAFSHCSSLTDITIPTNVTDIGDSAFSFCSGLTGIEIPSSVTRIGWGAFQACSAMESVTILEGVRDIGGSAFRHCSSMTSVTIPGSVATIGDSAFTGCSSLTQIQVHPSNTAYCDLDGVLFSKDKTTLLCCPGGKTGDYTVPDGVTRIGFEAFMSCHILTGVELPDSVRNIQSYAFVACTGLSRIVIPEGVVHINMWTFASCSNLTEITLPNSIIAIQGAAFYGCESFSDVYYSGREDQWNEVDITEGNNEAFVNAQVHYGILPVASGNCGAQGDNLTWKLYEDGTLIISGTGAMYDYTNYGNDTPWKNYESKIQKVLIKEGVTSIGAAAFATGLNGYPYLKQVILPTTVQTIGGSAFAYCSALEEIALPEGITEVSVQCFLGCTKLATVSLPSTLTTIDVSAFHFCSSLSDITIPYGVTKIGWQAFLGCACLKSISIPGTVERIETGAFDGSGLTYVNIPASVSWIGVSAFSSCPNLEEITVNYDNGNYCSQNGVLFSEDMSSLYCYPAGKSGSYYIPDGVTSIMHSAFNGAVGLSSVSIPDSVTNIEPFAFGSCTGLEEIKLPDSVNNLNGSAFSGCTGLTRVKLSSILTMIGYEAFRDCTNLADISIPVSITKVGADAFRNCTSLKDIYYGGTKGQWDAIEYLNGIGATVDGNAPLRNANIHYQTSFYTVSYDANGGYGAPESQIKTPGKSLTLTETAPNRTGFYFIGWAESPNTVEPDYARPGGTFTHDVDTVLYAVWAQPDFVLPAAITEIGEEAFIGGAFRFASLPEHAVSIGPRAFADCPKLRYIYIYDNITDIAADAFGDKETLTIFGVQPSNGVKSVAQVYAEAHGFTFIPVVFRGQVVIVVR